MSNRAATIAGLITVVAGFGLMATHYFAGTDGDPEGWFAAVGFGAPFVAAGALAFVGARWDLPTLRVAAGVALALISLVSFVMFPLLAAAGVMIGSAGNRSPNAASREFGSIVLSAIFAVCLVVAFAYLVFHQDPVTWSTPTGGGGSSNIVTNFEAAMSLTVSSVVVLGSVLWCRALPGRHEANG